MKTERVKFNGTTVVERYVIRTMTELMQYKEMFPHNYPVVKEFLIKEIRANNPIIIHENGSWCSQAKGEVEIVVNEETKVEKLIKEYKDELATLKHNMSEFGGNYKEHLSHEAEIRKTAKFIRDLKSLQV